MPTIPIRWSDNTTELRQRLRDGLNQIEATRAGAERMVRAFSGDKLFQAAHNFAAGLREVGGVQKLTNAELERGNTLLTRALEKYQALGRQAPAELRKLSAEIQKQQQLLKSSGLDARSLLGGVPGGALLSGPAAIGTAAGAALVVATRQAFQYADAITKAADRTGIGVEALQRLDAIARNSGNELGQLTSAINLFQKNIAENSPETIRALGQIGLSVTQLRVLSPEQQFLAIAKGIATIRDPAERAEVAMQLFGRAGAEILPSLTADVEKLSKATIQMSAETVKALDAAGDAYADVKVSFSNLVGEVVGGYLRMEAARARFFAAPGAAIGGVLFPSNLPTAPGTNIPLPRQMGVPGMPDAATMASIERQSKAIFASAEWELRGKKAQEAIDRVRESVRHLEVITAGYRTTVGELDATELKAIERWREKTEAVKDLAAELAKLHAVTIGAVEAGLLPGDRTNELGGLRERFDRQDQAADQAAEARRKSFQETQNALGALSQAVGQLGSMSRGAFGEVLGLTSGLVDGIGNMMRAVETFKSASLSSMLGVAAAAFQLGLAVGSLLRRLFDWLGSLPGALSGAARSAAAAAAAARRGASTGGLVTPFGIQRFAMGGIVQPMGRDTVPILAEPGEVILNKAQQAVLSSRSGDVTVNIDARGAFGVDRNALRVWGRMIAPAVAKAIAENKRGTETSGAFTTFRGALGMTS